MRRRFEHALIDDVHDRAASAFRKRTRKRLRQDEWRTQIDRQMPLPGIVRHRRPFVALEDRCAIDERRKRPEFGNGAANQRRDLILVSEIGLEESGFPVDAAYLGSGALRVGLRLIIMQRYVPAMPREIDRDRPAEPPGGSRNEDDVRFRHGSNAVTTRVHETNPTICFTSVTIGAAMARAFSAPWRRRWSISAGSASRRRISAAIGTSFVTEMSANSFLNAENC